MPRPASQYPMVRPKQSLGQNFLVDENIVRNIVRDLHPRPDDVLLEIGAGTGALTAHLVDRVRHLVVVEIDGRVIEDLRRRFASPTVTILHEDFLETDLKRLHTEFGHPLRIVGNLPYHLTSPILFRIFDSARWLTDATLMVQREVAHRIVADPGNKDYGILSVMTRFFGSARLLFDVSPNCFYPRPDVTSTLVHVHLGANRAAHPPVDEQRFATVVRTTFGKRRKTLRNSLRYLPFDEETVNVLLDGIRLPLDGRPEQLTVGAFVELAREIERLLNRP